MSSGSLGVEPGLGELLGSTPLLPFRGSWERASSSTAVLVVLGVAIAVTAVQLLRPDAHITQRFGLHSAVDLHESWRLVTWLFPHEVGPGHLLMNGMAIYLYGSLFSGAVGSGRFLALFLLTGAFGGAWSAAVAPATLSGNSGASQAVFGVFGGLLGASLAWALQSGDFAASKNVALMVGALLIFVVPLTIAGQVYVGGGFRPAIGVWGIIGHSPGFLAGVVLGFAYAHRQSPVGLVMSITASGLVAACALGFLVARRAPWPVFFPG